MFFFRISKISKAFWLKKSSKKAKCGKLFVNSFLSSIEIKVGFFFQKIAYQFAIPVIKTSLTLCWMCIDKMNCFSLQLCLFSHIRLVQPAYYWTPPRISQTSHAQNGKHLLLQTASHKWNWTKQVLSYTTINFIILSQNLVLILGLFSLSHTTSLITESCWILNFYWPSISQNNIPLIPLSL